MTLEELQAEIEDVREEQRIALRDRDRALNALRTADASVLRSRVKVQELEAQMQQELTVERKRADMVKQ